MMFCKVFCGFVVLLVAVVFPIALKSSRTLKLRVAIDMFGWGGVANIAKENAAERMLGKKHTHSRQAWHELLHDLGELDFEYLSAGRGVIDEEDIAEGYRFFTHIIKGAFDFHMELDPLHPRFTPIGNPNMKLLGDNPDSKYHIVNLDFGRTYRVWGTIQDEAYASFTLSEASCPGCFTNSAIGDMNHKSFKYKEDGKSFELFVGPERPERVDNFIQLKPSGPGTFVQLITRHYFERKVSVHTDPTVVPILGIELYGNAQLPPPPPIRGDAAVAQRLQRAKTFIREHTIGMGGDPSSAPTWFSFVANTCGKPESFREESQKQSAGGGMGAVDISYSGGTFNLAPDEALLMEAVIPDCTFANVMLWNRYLQSFDYINRPISLNRKQMSIKDGGRVKILISPSPPKAELGYDWLDTEGRKEGRIFWRFILPTTTPEQPKITLIKVAEVSHP